MEKFSVTMDDPIIKQQPTIKFKNGKEEKNQAFPQTHCLQIKKEKLSQMRMN